MSIKNSPSINGKQLAISTRFKTGEYKHLDTTLNSKSIH